MQYFVGLGLVFVLVKTLAMFKTSETSEIMLKMFTYLSDTSLESREPLSYGRINDRLVEMVPRFNNALTQLAND